MSDDVEPGFVRVRLDLSYDGRDFSGWARQREGQRTVQGEIEDALRVVLRRQETADLTVAGRTDSGVHARGQVAHVDLPQEVWAEHGEHLLRRLAGRLPMDVRVHRLAEAPPHFNARFSAIWRRYVYRVCDHPGGVDPLRRGHVLWHNRPLDVERDERGRRGAARRARLRRLLQEARGRHHDPHPAAAALGAPRRTAPSRPR